MKRTIIIICSLLLIAIIVIWTIYIKNTFKITMSIDNVSELRAYSVGTSLHTKDKDEIKKVIDLVNSMRFYDGTNLERPNESPDARVVLFDMSGNIIDRIDVHGEVAFYKGKRYGFFYWNYNRLGNLFKELR